MNAVLQSLGVGSVEALLKAVVYLVICLIVTKVIMSAVRKLLDKKVNMEPALRKFVASGIKALLVVVTIVIVANALGIETSSLIALISVAGLALSLSIQNVLANLFSGITLLATRPFKAGDLVEISGKTGIVKTGGLFYTELDTLDNVSISIPNNDVTGACITNYSHEPLRRVDRTYTVSYENDTQAVKDAILDAIAKDERILADPAPFVRLLEYKGSTVEYVVRVWCKNADYWDVYFNLNENVRASFADKGVKFSYEHVNVHIVEDKT